VGLLGGGEGGDLQGVLASLMGGAAQGDARGGPTADHGAVAAMAGQLLQAQLTAFGEQLKKAFRELRLTVSWQDGRAPQSLTVTTHLVVLNPKAPGGARGDNPEVPPNLATAAGPGVRGGAATPKGQGGASTGGKK
jgi:hypothetical protein